MRSQRERPIRRPSLGATRQIRHVALSPEATLIALAQQRDLVGFSTLEIYDTKTGMLVDTIEPIVEWQFEWTATDTLLALVPADETGPGEIDEHQIGNTVALATIDSPVVLLASQTGPG